MSNRTATTRQQIKRLKGGIRMLQKAITDHLEEVDSGQAQLRKHDLESWILYIRANDTLIRELEKSGAPQSLQLKDPRVSEISDQITKLEQQANSLIKAIDREGKHVHSVLKVRDKKINELERVLTEIVILELPA